MQEELMEINDFINRKDLAERLDNDIELFRELAELFIEDSTFLMEKIQNSIESSDANQLRKSAHTIKGSVSNFSAQKAYDSAFRLETIGKNEELDKAETAFKELRDEVNNLKEAMKLLVKEKTL
jgi:two-component system, sensor histidine kinase and response regulator